MKINFNINDDSKYNLSLRDIQKKNGVYSTSLPTENKHKSYAFVLNGLVYTENGDDFLNGLYKFKYIPNGSITINFD
jgi:hypothetical protein